MREYETVYIMKPTLTEAEQTKIKERNESVVLKFNGTIFFNKTMGKKNLSYPIKKQNKGIYYCLDYASEGGAVGELERQMRLDENVLRFLTVVRQDEVDIDARKLEVETQKDELVSFESESAVPPPARDTDVEDEE